MLKRGLTKVSWCELRKRYAHKYAENAKITSKVNELAKIRNIGIMAHIDAGKTTTTERMLFYSGLIQNMGEVHHGNTVTDYMEQERERGITITSAAVTFSWKNYRINLIDTPGHIDFTMEVEQTLRVLDGSIVVLDGSAGVEAQTLTVCRQADKYNIPSIIYVNKMDRHDANFDMCLKSIETQLGFETFPVQFPIKEKGTFLGIIDIINLEKLTFDKNSDGMKFTKTSLKESDDGKLWETANEQRRLLADKLSGVDDNLANVVIEQESLDTIPANALTKSLRKVTIARKGVPVLLGSSYKNIGVQPLMDGIILYLPSPTDNVYANQYSCFDNNLSARVFKVIHDQQRGPITFFRIHSGDLKKGAKVYNIQKEKTEQCTRLYTPFADEYEEINEISAGNIVGVTGLKYAVIGDLITNSASAFAQARASIKKQSDMANVVEEDIFTMGSNIPDPVFFCSIEAPSLTQQAALETALEQLSREDPSLRVKQNVESGQIELAGMGELHLDIIKERIRTKYKIDATLGPLQIAYKESILHEVKDTYTSQHKIGSSNHFVQVTLSLLPEYKGKQILLFDRTQDSASNIDNIHPSLMPAIIKGVKAGLSHGPKLYFPVINVGVKLHWLEVERGTTKNIVTASVAQCIKKLLQSTECRLLEPIMHLEIVATEEHSSKILADLARRRTEIQGINVRGSNKVFVMLAPLAELLGFAKALRILSSGTATFSLEFSHYQEMSPHDEQEAIRKVTGF